jgi:hypothetical protein
MARFHACIVLLAATAMPMGGAIKPARGEDFRVDNAVYAGVKQELSSRSTTIFHDGLVYDCLTAPDETVVFDKTAGRFVLLNMTHRVRSELTTAEVAAFIDSLKSAAVKSKDPITKFLAGPTFQEHFDQSTSELTLSSPWVNYRLTLAPQPNQDVVRQYQEFCDWYARLNALLFPGSWPPFARLAADAAMAKHEATASQVLLKITAAKGSKPQPTTIRSEHRLTSQLSPADLQRVTQIREFMGSFKPVSFEKYRKLEPR